MPFCGSRAEKPDAYRLASPTTFVTKDDPPAFFFHGEKDRLVPKLSPIAMQLLLKGVGVDARLHMVAGAGHIQAVFNREALGESFKFLDEKLKAATKVAP